MTPALVLDASAMVAMLVNRRAAASIASRLRGCEVHVPAHFDAEVLSALGRIHRAADISDRDVSEHLGTLAAAPFARHPLGPLLASAWRRRGNARLVDALYVALAESLASPLVTLDQGLASATPHAELVDV